MDTQKKDNDKAGLDSTLSKGVVPNVGTGPATSIPDGGEEGEAKQPKENTGNMTEMGGATGGIPKSETEGVDNEAGKEGA